MKKVLKNKKLIYGIMTLIILLGIIATYVFRLNFTLEYSQNTKINVYIGKEYNLADIQNIAEEVFGTKEINYQEIERFGEAVSITVKEASDEQITNLTNKIKEKYELESTEGLIQTTKIGHLRGRDIVKPYIVPMVITTVLILAYVGIRYTNLGVYKTIFTLLARLIYSEALYLSIIAIARLTISVYTMPVAIGLYILVTIVTVAGYQKRLDKISEEASK